MVTDGTYASYQVGIANELLLHTLGQLSSCSILKWLGLKVCQFPVFISQVTSSDVDPASATPQQDHRSKIAGWQLQQPWWKTAPYSKAAT